MVEYLSFGGGPPSLALLILNAWGEIQPKAELVLFADTGAEKQRTYELMPVYEDWAAEMGIEFQKTQAHMGSLEDRVNSRKNARRLPIPIFTETGMAKRICTVRWKIQACENYLSRRYGRRAKITAQIAFCWGEAHRNRDARYKRTTNRWPLQELPHRLTRQDCIEIIKMAGLPVPPWSACYFCPLQNNARWGELASRFPEDFTKAVEVDNSLEGEGFYLHQARRRLSGLYTTDQLHFPLGEDGDIEQCSDGNCFT